LVHCRHRCTNVVCLELNQFSEVDIDTWKTVLSMQAR